MIFPALGLYLHIPWCPTRCIYCDFNTYVDGEAALKQRYQTALVREIREAGAALGRPLLQTIFIGGGTPTSLAPAHLVELVDEVRASFSLRPDAEVTAEANPGTLSVDYLREIRQGGINRLSLGVQSFNDEELRFLSRLHDARAARLAVEQARAAGFDNLSLDLIFNLPRQSLAQWQFNVQAALQLAPEHVSFYALIVEPGTPLQRQVAQGQVPLPDDEIAADMYAYSIEALGAAGYLHYEISNWAKADAKPARLNSPSHFPSSQARLRAEGPLVAGSPILPLSHLPPSHSPTGTPEANWQTPRLASAHNLIYWRNQSYLGLGAGAYGTLNGERWMNVKRPQTYLERVEAGAGLGPARDDKSYERIDRDTAMAEHMLLGLRLVREGVSAAEFQARFGLSLREHYRQAISFGLERGLSEWVETPQDLRLRLTRPGRFLANQVMLQFMN